MSSQPEVAVLGGTGAQGSGLALRLALAGLPVVIGSRSAEKAQVRAHELSEEAGVLLAGSSNEDAASAAGLVVVAVPFAEAGPLLSSLASRWRPGAIVIDVTVPLLKSGGALRLLDLPEGSASAALSATLPAGVKLVGAAKTLPAGLLGKVEAPLDCDELVYGEDEPARLRVIELLRRIPSLRPLDAGGIAAAPAVERMALLAIQMNRRHRVHHCRFKVVGLG